MGKMCTSLVNKESTYIQAIFLLILLGMLTVADEDVICPSILVLHEHETGTIACNFTTKYDIGEIRWIKNNISIRDLPFQGYKIVIGGGLQIVNATKQQEGLYSLVLVPLNSSIHFNIPITNVTVQGKKRLLTTPVSRTTEANANFITKLTAPQTIEKRSAYHVILWIIVSLIIVIVSAIVFGGLYHYHRLRKRKRLNRMDSIAGDAVEMTTRLLTSTESVLVSNICKNLKEVYKKLVSQQKIAPWLDPMRLDTYFVNLSLQCKKTENFHSIDSYNTSLETVSDILKLPGRRTVIYGDAGSGKTTLTLKVIYDWLEGKCLPEVNFPMLLRFRLLDPSCKSFVESILVLCGEEATDEKCAQLEEAVENSPERYFMIFDGLDEMSSELEGSALSRDIFAILRREKFPNVNLLLTLRKSAARKIQDINFDNEVNVNGFTKEQTIEFVKQKFFRSKPKLGEEAITYLESRGMMEEVGEVPLILTFYCALIQRNVQRNLSTTPSTLTGLVEDAYETYIEHYEEKFPDVTGTDEIHKLTIALGRIAYNGLQGNSNLIWNTTEFCEQLSEEQYDLAVKIGIIKVESNISYLPSAARLKIRDAKLQCVMFPHKLIQEFIAAYFIAHLPVDEREEEICTISKKVNEMGNVLRFACGINSDAAKSILTALPSSIEYESMFKILCLHEYTNEHVNLKDNKKEHSVTRRARSPISDQSACLWTDLASISTLTIRTKLESCAVCTTFRLFHQEKSSLRLHLRCDRRGPDCVRQLLLDGGNHCLAGFRIDSSGHDAYRSQSMEDILASNLNHLVIWQCNLKEGDSVAILQWCMQRPSITELIFYQCYGVDKSLKRRKLTKQLKLQRNTNVFITWYSGRSPYQVVDHTYYLWRAASADETERTQEVLRKFSNDQW